MRPINAFLWLGLFISLGLFFQNCAKSDLVVEGSVTASSTQTPVPIVSFQSKPNCVFNGAMLQEGQSVAAYLNSTPEPTGGCLSEIRTCRNGVLTGSFSFASCRTGSRSCLFNGQTLSSGQTVTAYSSMRDGACQFEQRQCADGVLSGSYPFSQCSSGARQCLFGEQTLQANQAFVFFYLGSCTAQTGYCQAAGFLTDNRGTPLPPTVQSACSSKGTACSFNGASISPDQRFTYFSPDQSCASREGRCDGTTGQLKDNSSGATLDWVFSDAQTCQIAGDTSLGDIGSVAGSTGSGTLLYAGIPTCNWKNTILKMGDRFKYYHYSSGYSYMCAAREGVCAADGSLRTWPYYRRLNVDSIHTTCTVLQQYGMSGAL